MGVEKLQRVCRHLRERYPDAKKITRQQLDKAIIMECGYTYSTQIRVKKALIKIGWLRKVKTKFYLTNKDVTGDFD